MTLTPLKEKRVFRAEEMKSTFKTEEFLAFCPGCKALQTVWLTGNALMPTRKFSQAGNQVYHNCGSNRPCRLYFGI